MIRRIVFALSLGLGLALGLLWLLGSQNGAALADPGILYVAPGGDCNDGAPAVNPGADEICNGVDDDCDPLTDEAVDGDGDGVSICGDDGDGHRGRAGDCADRRAGVQRFCRADPDSSAAWSSVDVSAAESTRAGAAAGPGGSAAEGGSERSA